MSCIYIYVCLFIYLLIYIYICVCVYLFIYLFTYWFIYLIIYLDVCVYLYIHMFIYLFINLWYHWSIYLFICLFISLFISFFIYLSIHLFIHLFVYLGDFRGKKTLGLDGNYCQILNSEFPKFHQSPNRRCRAPRLRWVAAVPLPTHPAPGQLLTHQTQIPVVCMALLLGMFHWSSTPVRWIPMFFKSPCWPERHASSSVLWFKIPWINVLRSPSLSTEHGRAHRCVPTSTLHQKKENSQVQYWLANLKLLCSDMLFVSLFFWSCCRSKSLQRHGAWSGIFCLRIRQPQIKWKANLSSGYLVFLNWKAMVFQWGKHGLNWTAMVFQWGKHRFPNKKKLSNIIKQLRSSINGSCSIAMLSYQRVKTSGTCNLIYGHHGPSWPTKIDDVPCQYIPWCPRPNW